MEYSYTPTKWIENILPWHSFCPFNHYSVLAYNKHTASNYLDLLKNI